MNNLDRDDPRISTIDHTFFSMILTILHLFILGLVYIRELGIGFDIPNVDLDCKGKISFMSSRGLSFSIAMVA